MGMKAMIMAAGLGQRLRPLTAQRPKPLIPVAGKPLMEYHLEALAVAGIHEVVINLGYLGEQIFQRFKKGHAFGLSIEYTWEDPILDVGGGICNALPLLGKRPFWVINGDIWTDFNFQTLTLPAQSLAHVVLAPNPGHHPQGDFSLEDGQVMPKCGAQRTYTYTGIGVFSPQFFAQCPDGPFPLKPLLDEAISQKRLSGECYTGSWSDVGTLARLQSLENRLESSHLKINRARMNGDIG